MSFRVLRNGYVFNRSMMKAFFFPALFVLLAVMIWGQVHAPVFQCLSGEDYCLNPYYDLCDKKICSQEYVKNTNIPFWVEYGDMFSILLAMSYFLVNHIRHNKDFKQ